MSMNKGVTFDGFSDNWFRQLSEKIGIQIQKTSPKLSQLKNWQRSDRIHLRLSNLNEHSITLRGGETVHGYISDDCLFVDLKSAYNAVNRKTMFSFIQKEEILNQSESVFR